MGAIDPIYLEHLQAVQGIRRVRTKADQEHDALITIESKSGPHCLIVQQHRSHLTHEMADHLIAQARRQSSPTLLLAPSVGAPLGAKLASAGVNYLDRAGNCHLALGELYVHVEGRTAPAQPTTDKGLRAAGYQVLFCYLAQPDLLNATVRTVAAAAGVSRQPVSDMRRRLIDDEYVIEAGSTCRWNPRRRQDALGLWLHGYETTVRPTLIWGTYRTNDPSPKELEERLASTFEAVGVSEFRWGGSAAGFRLTGHYRGERTIVHVHATPGDLRQRLRMLSDPQGNLVLMDAFGEINWQVQQETVHPLLVYSEMLRENSERASEAAQELFTARIQPLWSDAK
jgi:hypothetical protein